MIDGLLNRQKMLSFIRRVKMAKSHPSLTKEGIGEPVPHAAPLSDQPPPLQAGSEAERRPEHAQQEVAQVDVGRWANHKEQYLTKTKRTRKLLKMPATRMKPRSTATTVWLVRLSPPGHWGSQGPLVSVLRQKMETELSGVLKLQL